MSDEKNRDQGRFLVRMSPELRERIALIARQNSRSMNSEIVATLEREYPPNPSLDEILNDIDDLLDIAIGHHSRSAMLHVKQKLIKMKEFYDAGEYDYVNSIRSHRLNKAGKPEALDE